MNIVNNKRKRNSVERIEKIFLQLIQTKEIEQISVTDICKLANLNRTTFYSNYVDIYDLVDSIRKKMIDNFLEVYSEEKNQMKHSYDFSKLFRHIKDNQSFYKTYFKLNFDLLEDDFLVDEKEFIKYYGTFDNRDYHIIFFKSGLNAVIKKWLDGGCKESPDEIYEIIKSEYKKELF